MCRDGPRLCENSKTLNRDRTSYSFEIVFVPTSQARSILKSNLRISFSSRFDFLSFHTAWAHRNILQRRAIVVAFRVEADIRSQAEFDDLVENDCAARLAAIPAGESPANRGVQSLL